MLVALLLLALGAATVGTTLVAATRSQRTAGRWLTAVHLAADGIEQLRAGLALAPVQAEHGCRRSGRARPDPEVPGVVDVEVAVEWDDDGPREYRLRTSVLR